MSEKAQESEAAEKKSQASTMVGTGPRPMSTIPDACTEHSRLRNPDVIVDPMFDVRMKNVDMIVVPDLCCLIVRLALRMRMRRQLAQTSSGSTWNRSPPNRIGKTPGGRDRRTPQNSVRSPLVSTESGADEILGGGGEIWIKGYRSLNPRSGRLPSNGTPVYAGYLSVELRNRKARRFGRTWRRPGAASEDVSKDLSKRIAKHVAEALEAEGRAGSRSVSRPQPCDES